MSTAGPDRGEDNDGETRLHKLREKKLMLECLQLSLRIVLLLLAVAGVGHIARLV